MITKLDLMDEGTDARDVLENKLLPLRRGTRTPPKKNPYTSLPISQRAQKAPGGGGLKTLRG